MLVCDFHARSWTEDVPEGWEHEGIEPYARMCEETVNVLARVEGEHRGHEVLEIVFLEARANRSATSLSALGRSS